ncbi:MAG: hypothetical protein ACKV2T_31135 [Kofleriaceae bacterium]
MKALPPPPNQLALLPRRHDLARVVVEPSVRQQILRALAELLLVAAEQNTRKEDRDETR